MEFFPGSWFHLFLFSLFSLFCYISWIQCEHTLRYKEVGCLHRTRTTTTEKFWPCLWNLGFSSGPRNGRALLCQKATGWSTHRSYQCNVVSMVQWTIFNKLSIEVWPKPPCKAQGKGEEDEADRGRGGKTTVGNGQAWVSPSPRGQWKSGENGGNWLWNHLWCPNNPCS